MYFIACMFAIAISNNKIEIKNFSIYRIGNRFEQTWTSKRVAKHT